MKRIIFEKLTIKKAKRVLGNGRCNHHKNCPIDSITCVPGPPPGGGGDPPPITAFEGPECGQNDPLTPDSPCATGG